MLQGIFLILLLGLTLAGLGAGPLFSLFGIDIWALLIGAIYCLSLYLIQRYDQHERWQPRADPGDRAEDQTLRREQQENQTAVEQAKAALTGYDDWSLTRLLLYCSGGAVLILTVGVMLAQVGEALAEQSGLGASFVGITLLGFATALPEISATVTAVRIGNYEMAIADILGSNAFVLGLLFVVDLAYHPGPILAEAGPTAFVGAAAGVVVTAVLLAGLIERRDRTILNMGFDSAAILVAYIGSIVVLYVVRG
jgi:cation:H+ antiporter